MRVSVHWSYFAFVHRCPRSCYRLSCLDGEACEAERRYSTYLKTQIQSFLDPIQNRKLHLERLAKAQLWRMIASRAGALITSFDLIQNPRLWYQDDWSAQLWRIIALSGGQERYVIHLSILITLFYFRSDRLPNSLADEGMGRP